MPTDFEEDIFICYWLFPQNILNITSFYFDWWKHHYVIISAIHVTSFVYCHWLVAIPHVYIANHRSQRNGDIFLFAQTTKMHQASSFNSSPPGQNGRHFADVFGCIFVNAKFCILIVIPLKLVPEGQIDKPLSESILTRFTDAYMRY